MANNPQSTQNQGFNSTNTSGFYGSNTVNNQNFINTGNANQILKDILLKNLPNGAEVTKTPSATATFLPTDDTQPDYRVKVSVPSLSTFRSSPILSPLAKTGYNVVFPISPNITFVHSANYDELTPVHNNYPFPSYVNSRTEDITISGNFPVQTQEDGLYWIAATHCFRSLTKMFYGETSDKGAPPPVVKLNGYGSYVMNNIPVVVTQFTFDLPNDVDYLQIGTARTTSSPFQMVPTNSTLNVTLKPLYSRSKVNEFSLDDFVNGSLANKGFV
jgi:hypothetical protein